MEIYRKVKLIREYKNLSQEFVAHELGMSQSQYSRRETGEVPFSVVEIERLAIAFELEVSQLYNKEVMMLGFSKDKQEGATSLPNYVSVPDKLIQQYEKRIEEKDEIIFLLKERIESLLK